MILRWLMLKFWNFLKLPSSIYSLYGEESFDKIQNKVILTVSIKFIVDSDRFMVLFFSIRNNFVHLFYCWVLLWQWLVHSVVIISITFHNFFNTIFHWIRINSNPMVATKQNIFVTLTSFWSLKGVVDEWQKCDNNLFWDNVEWSSNNFWKMISADAKAYKNSEK